MKPGLQENQSLWFDKGDEWWVTGDGEMELKVKAMEEVTKGENGGEERGGGKR